MAKPVKSAECFSVGLLIKLTSRSISSTENRVGSTHGGWIEEGKIHAEKLAKNHNILDNCNGEEHFTKWIKSVYKDLDADKHHANSIYWIIYPKNVHTHWTQNVRCLKTK